MRHALMLVMLLMLAACDRGGTQSGSGGAATGPTVNVQCHATASGGGTVGDTTVNVDCPETTDNSTNPAPTP